MEKGTWQIIKSMSQKRDFSSVAILNGLIYVVGGFEREFSRFSALVESYNPKTDQWTERRALAEIGVLRSLVAFNGLLYAFSDGQGVGEYDPVENIWTKVNAQTKR